jgi:hypothetical protein
MNHQILRRSAIVCSTLAVCAQPALPQQPVGTTEEGSTQTPLPASSAPSARPTQNAAHSVPLIGSLPERLSIDLQWGNSHSHRLSKEMEAVYKKMLEQSQATVRQGQLAKAIAMVAGIPKNSRHYTMARQLEEDWSQELLQRATNDYQQAKLTTAMAMLDAIPATSTLYPRMSELKHRWTQEAALLKQAIASHQAGNWRRTMDALKSLEGTALYHSLPVQEMIQQTMNKMFEPDEALMRLSSPTLSETSGMSSPPMRSPVTTAAPSLEPMPASSDLVIQIDQAIAWAQPPALMAKSKPPLQSSTAATNRLQSSADVSLDVSLMKPAMGLPKVKLHPSGPKQR